MRRSARLLALLMALAVPLPAAAAGTSEPQPQVHVVYAGQRLGSIAKRYNVTIEALCAANDLRPSDPIRPGQRLVIPSRDDRDGSAARRYRQSQGGGSDTGHRASPPAPAAAPERRTHVVYAGHTLGKISARYQVSIEAICAANAISPDAPIRPGQVLVIPAEGDTTPAPSPAASAPTSPTSLKPTPTPPTGSTTPRRHVVASGHTLGKISARYSVSIDAICAANGIQRSEPLKQGQVLLVPGPGDPEGSAAARLRRSGALDPSPARPSTQRTPSQRTPSQRTPTTSTRGAPSWYPYRKPPWRRGFVTLVGYNETWRGYVIGPDGQVLPAAHQAICRLMGADGDHPRVDRRLVKFIARVSDTFGGRSIRVVSGFRTESYALSSRHRRSQALDFSIPGVPNEALRDYLLTFSGVGVGYYPNSSFVHLDVRDQKTYWVDMAGPGEAPRYAR